MEAASRFTVTELARRGAVSVATLKFYLREGLLHGGDLGRPGRAYYDESHVERLALIRAMRDVAGLPVAVIRRVVGALERPTSDAVSVIAPAVDALTAPKRTRGTAAEMRRARAEVDVFLAGVGLNVRKEAAAKRTLAETLAALRRLTGKPIPAEELAPYFEAIRGLAEEEIARAAREEVFQTNTTALHRAILGTVLWEPVLLACRRLWHEHLTTELVRGKKETSS
jgi:DNA-binding transcriptional MerR regulator